VLLEKGVDMYDKYRDGSAFYLVFYHSKQKCEANSVDPKMIKLFLEFGADVNRFCGFNETALHMAAYTGCLVCLTLLLNNGADPNLNRGNRNSPLQYIRDSIECMQTLLYKGADPNLVPLANNFFAGESQSDEIKVLKATTLICGGADYAENIDFKNPKNKAFILDVVKRMGGDEGIREMRRKFELNRPGCGVKSAEKK